MPAEAANPSPYRGCAFLGVAEDSQTRLAYPSPANLCYCASPAQSVPIQHQEIFCLQPAYERCPIYSECLEIGRLDAPLPLDAPASAGSGRRRSPWPWYGLAFLIAALLLGTYFALTAGLIPVLSGLPVFGALPTATATPTGLPTAVAALPSATFTATPEPSPTSTPEPSLTPTETPVPTATGTPTLAAPTPGPGFGITFGPGERFLLHQVGEGEFYAQIARLYDTTVRVLQAVNSSGESAILRPGTVLVVLPGETDHTAVTPYLAVLVETPTPLTDLAIAYGLTLEDLRLLNDLGPYPDVPAGRWLVVPAP